MWSKAIEMMGLNEYIANTINKPVKKKYPYHLKPCPYCGSTKLSLCRIVIPETGYFVECDKCHFTGPTRFTMWWAVKAWNHKAKKN